MDGRTNVFDFYILRDSPQGYILSPIISLDAPKPRAGPSQYLVDYTFTPDGFLWSLWTNEQFDSTNLYRSRCDPFLLLVSDQPTQTGPWFRSELLPRPVSAIPFPPNTSLDPQGDSCKLIM